MLLFFSLKSYSQTTNNIMQTIISTGYDASGGSGTVAYSIGQICYTEIGGSTYKVEQGIQHQFKDGNLGIPEVPNDPKTEIVLFPNPTRDFVNVKMNESAFTNEKRSYQLYDIQGRLIKQNTINEAETQINLTGLSSSVYLLKVNVNNKPLKTFKILKN